MGLADFKDKLIDFKDLAAGIKESAHYRLYVEPETNIVTYFPSAAHTAQISVLSDTIMKRGMASKENQLFLATLNVNREHFSRNHPDIAAHGDYMTILRSCLLKPEHKLWVPKILESLDNLHVNSEER